MKRVFVGLGFLSAIASAQNAPAPEITGTVLEFRTGYGISGAQVTLTKDGSKQPDATTTTDSQGKFDFKLPDTGHFSVVVKMDGYQAPPFFTGGDVSTWHGTQANVVLTHGNLTEDLRFELMRPAELKGRVVDAQTDTPLARVRVEPVSPSRVNGQPVVTRGQQVVTDANGEFVMTGLAPANYAVETLPSVRGETQVMTQFTPEDANAVDQDFDTSFWPGGNDAVSAVLVPLGSGQSLSVGTIRARLVPYYRVRVKLDAANCPSGQKAHLQFPTVATAGGTPILNSDVPCGSDFLIRGVAPGSYKMALTAGRADTYAQAIVPVIVTDRNTSVFATLERGVDVDVRITFADGASQPPAAEAFTLLSGYRDAPVAFPPFNPDAQWRANLANQPLGKHDVQLLRSSAGFYLREVRYNGHPQVGFSFTLDADSPAHVLEIVLDDKPGSIIGTVEDGDRPANKPYVIATKYPLPADVMSESLRNTTGGEDGKFRLSGLTPGEYRVLAVPAASREWLNQPGLLDRLLSSSEKVTIDRGGTQDVHLKLTDPSR